MLRFPWFDPILRILTAVLAYMYKACAMADPAMTLAIRLARRNGEEECGAVNRNCSTRLSGDASGSKGRREAVQLIGYLPTNSEQCGPST